MRVPRRFLPWLLALTGALCAALPGSVRAQNFDSDLFEPLNERLIDRLEEQYAKDASGWEAEAELGFLGTSGNTFSRSTHASTRVVNDRRHWRHTLRAEGLRTESSAEGRDVQVRLNLRSAYKLTRADYLFGALRYDRADAQGIDSRYSEVLGYGRLLGSKPLTLVLEAGAGQRQTRRTESAAVARGPVGVLIGELGWRPHAGPTFNTYLVIESGKDNTYVLSQTALTWKLRGDLSTRISHDVTYNSDVPEGVLNTDRTTSVTLVYQF